MGDRFVGEPLKAANTCMPRLRGGRRPHRPAAATPLSMLDRLRDAGLRLIMLSVASRSLQQPTTATPAPRRRESAAAAASSRIAARTSPCHPDSYLSEAVDECIEFLKRSAAGAGGGRGGAPACVV